MNSYTGPCPAKNCDELFVSSDWKDVARHLRREWDLPVSDMDVLVPWTKMIIRTQAKNDINPWP